MVFWWAHPFYMPTSSIMHRSKRIVQFVLVTAGAFALGVAIDAVNNARLRAAISRTAFTARTLTIYSNPDGSEVGRESGVEAYRSDGSQAIELQRHVYIPGSPAEPDETRTIFDLPARRRVMIDPFTESMSTWALSDEEVRHFRTKHDCLGKTEHQSIELSPQVGTILGYRVVKKITTPPTPIDGRFMRFEGWVATELDCYQLRSTILDVTAPTAPVTRTQFEVVEIIPGEPDGDLFDIPAGYTERSPEDIEREVARRKGEPFELSHGVEVQTREYHQRRPSP